MGARGLLGAFALVAIGACTGSQPKPDGPLIDSLQMQGAKQINQGDVGKKILTTPSSIVPGWTPFFGHDEYFDQIAWQADLRRVERYYQTQGYYQAKVVDDEVIETKPGHVALTIKVVEGLQTKVISIAVQGLEPLPKDQQDSVQANLHVKVDTPFLEEEWEHHRYAVRDLDALEAN